ncbi:MAG: DegT/DnrJ/EryC1/StrS family aminotransferase [Saprospiraceae bacterium]|nr:DegT/DnrJ/EryC1/StrS family aminotransferase [Saprospiraceae bacterium]MDW8228600.1 DegT/DnrJ/EryC1/StrS family aminotransferase [Saprospiraceae bacterium]
MIRMVDLKTQYENMREEIDRAVLEVIASTEYINGTAVKRFQAELEEYLQVKHVIPCANGTDALQIAMMALELKPGDEVIVPAFTYVATAEVIALLGLTPVMVDVYPDSFNINVEQARAAITPRTRAIVPVHLFGQSADMEPILQMAQQHNLYVIEDNAQATGSDYCFSDGECRKTGTMGHIGCTSFFPSKNLGCYGDGGAMMTHDDDLAQRLRMVANHGQNQLYHHAVIGVNSRLDSIQAAVLSVKLKRLDQYNANRRRAADYYDAAFGDMPQLKIPTRSANTTHVFHQYTLVLREGNRDALKQHLAERGIPAMVYYPIPLYKQQAFARYWAGGELPVTEQLCRSVISLPMHSELTLEQQDQIVEGVRSFFA